MQNTVPKKNERAVHPIKQSINNMDCQDWNEVVLAKRPAKGTTSRAPVSGEAIRLRRLEEDDVPVKLRKTLSAETRQEIIKARVANGWNQTQLNMECAFPSNTIRDIESGKQVPTPTQLNVLNRTLKLALKYSQ